MNHFMESNLTIEIVSLSNDKETCESEPARLAHEGTRLGVQHVLQGITKYERRIDLTGSLFAIIVFLKSSICSFLYFSVEIIVLAIVETA